MFVRTKVFKNKDGSARTYLQLVTTERVGGKVRQRVVANLGRLDELQDGGAIDKLIEHLARFSKKQYILDRVRQIEAKQAKTWGPVLIFRRLWEELRLSATFDHLLEKTGVETDFEEAAFAMVLNRLLDPMSKLRVSEWVKTIYRPEWDKLELHHFYRALDFLAEHKIEFEQALHARVWDLFNLRLDLLLWDTTTTYFEGRAAEDLAEFGFSKDNRPDRVQVMIGVLLSRDGFPIAHEVFPGNTAEVDTFRQVVDKVQRHFNLRRVILVADRGMVSEELLGEIEAAGLEYIVGVRMRRLKVAEEVLSRPGRYHKANPNLWVKEVMHQGVRYIVCFNPEEKERDRQTREEAVGRLRDKLEAGQLRQLIGNSAYRRYLKLDGANVSIDTEALEHEARYDGKYVLRTNCSLSPEEVAESYKSLWQVERAFRELKSGLELRPVYHWTEKRIRGHIMVCFLAVVLEIALRRKIRDQGVEVRYDDLLLDLCQLKAVDLCVDGTRYLARTELTGCAEVAFRAVGVRPPQLVTEMPRV
ncbi:MAG TPA: IS1634 family transposase [Firmicutes bacterium]|nr:IS1634 family transposase [Bacillota bacterium]